MPALKLLPALPGADSHGVLYGKQVLRRRAKARHQSSPTPPNEGGHGDPHAAHDAVSAQSACLVLAPEVQTGQDNPAATASVRKDRQRLAVAARAKDCRPMTPERFREIMGPDVIGLGDDTVSRMIKGLDGLADIVCELTLTKSNGSRRAS